MTTGVTFLLELWICLLFWSLGIFAETPLVQTQNGSLRGLYSPVYQQEFFLNVPYAAPPMGSLRFNAPQPYANTYQDRDASQYGAACIGYNSMTSISQVYAEMSEDCLTLNIVRPSDASSKSISLPVMVWIHGGGFQFGSGIDTRLDLKLDKLFQIY